MCLAENTHIDISSFFWSYNERSETLSKKAMSEFLWRAVVVNQPVTNPRNLQLYSVTHSYPSSSDSLSEPSQGTANVGADSALIETPKSEVTATAVQALAIAAKI